VSKADRKRQSDATVQLRGLLTLTAVGPVIHQGRAAPYASSSKRRTAVPMATPPRSGMPSDAAKSATAAVPYRKFLRPERMRRTREALLLMASTAARSSSSVVGRRLNFSKFVHLAEKVHVNDTSRSLRVKRTRFVFHVASGRLAGAARMPTEGPAPLRCAAFTPKAPHSSVTQICMRRSSFQMIGP
jgi:hypothetical protein